METTYESQNAFLALFGGAFLTFCTVVGIFMTVCLWKIFTKAGQEGWKAIIPIYNIYIWIQIVGKPGWWLLLFLIPGVNLVIAIWLTNLLSKSFGKSEGFTIGLIFLGIVFYPILAFDRTITYKGPAGDPTRSITGDLSSIGQKLQ